MKAFRRWRGIRHDAHDWLRAFNALGPEGLNRLRGPKIAAAPVAELERVIGR
jgi:hypothetical protein